MKRTATLRALVPLTTLALSCWTLAGCGEPEGEEPPAGAPETAIAEDADGPDGQSPPLVEGTVATVTIDQPLPAATVGDDVLVTATARDASGVVVVGATIQWLTGDERSLEPLASGALRAHRDGVYPLHAYVGTVTSEPKWLYVGAPEPVRANTPVTVELPPGLAGRAVAIRGGHAVTQAADGSWAVERRVDRNQLLVAMDADSDEVLLLGVAGGDGPNGSTDAVHLNLASTAEALLFLQPPFVHRDPVAIAGFRKLAADEPALADIATSLALASQNGQVWTRAHAADPLQAGTARLAAKLRSARRALDTAIAEHLAKPDGGKADSAVPLGPLKPKVAPAERSGITVTVTPCVPEGPSAGPPPFQCPANPKPSLAVVTLENRYSRWVQAFLEPRTAAFTPIGPITIAAATQIPSLWQFILSGLDGEFDTELFMGSSSTSSASRLVDFDPNLGANPWDLLTYGPGLGESTVPPALYDAEKTFSRSATPWVATVLLELVFNVLGLFDNDEQAKCALSALIDVDPGNALSFGADVTVEAFEGGKMGDIWAAVVDTITDSAVALASDCAYLGESSWASTILGVVFSPWDTIADIVNAASTLVDVYLAAPTDWFGLSGNMLPVLEPFDRVLPKAHLGCPYEATVAVAVLDYAIVGEYGWAVKLPGGAGWYWSATGPKDSAVLVETLAGTVVAPQHLNSEGELEFTVSVIMGDDARNQVVLDTGIFRATVLDDGPQLDGLLVGDGDPMAPGSFHTIDATMVLCGSPVGLKATLISDVLAQDVELLPDASGTLTGVLEVGFGAPEGPAPAVIQVETADGAIHAATFTLQIGSGEPRMPHQTVVLLPGEPHLPEVWVNAPNYEGELPDPTTLPKVTSSVNLSLFSAASAPPGLDFYLAPELSEPGKMVLQGNAVLTVQTPLSDTDGVDGTDPSIAGVVALNATSPAGSPILTPGGAPPELRYVVGNVAPSVAGPASPLVVADEEGAMLELLVTDANGPDDVGGIEVVGVDPGLGEPLMEIVGTDTRFTYTLTSDALDAACDAGCEVTFRALDADDVEANGGYSEPFTITIIAGVLVCETAADCPMKACAGATLTTWACLNKACTADAVDCAASDLSCEGEAGAAECTAECVTDEACPDECDLGQVVDMACEAKKCVPVTYQSCGSGASCQDGVCSTKCTSTADCGPPACDGWNQLTYTCVGGNCVGQPSPCPSGEACLEGQCVTPCTGSPSCTFPCANDVDCPPGTCAGPTAKSPWICGDGTCEPGPAVECTKMINAACWEGQCVHGCGGFDEEDLGCPQVCANAAAVEYLSCIPAPLPQPQFTGYCGAGTVVACGAGEACLPPGWCKVPCTFDTDCGTPVCTSAKGFLKPFCDTSLAGFADPFCNESNQACFGDDTCVAGKCEGP